MTTRRLALVLSFREISESDLWISFLSPEGGRFFAVAKGGRRSRRRFVNKFEVLHLLRVHLRRGRPGLAPLIEAADLLFAPEAIRKDPRRFVLGSYLAELCERACPPAEGREVFPLLWQAVGFLERSPFPLLKAYFESQLLKILGWSPELRTCLSCGCRVTEAYFSFEGGGLRCKACAREGDSHLSSRTRALLEALQRLNFKRASRLRARTPEIKEISMLLEGFLQKVLDQDIKALKILHLLEGRG